MNAKDFMQLIIKQLRVISLQSTEAFENILNEEFNINNNSNSIVNDYLSPTEISVGSGDLTFSGNSATLFYTNNYNECIENIENIDNMTLFAEGFIISDFQNQFSPELPSLPSLPSAEPTETQIQPPISSYNGYHVSSSSVHCMFYDTDTLFYFC